MINTLYVEEDLLFDRSVVVGAAARVGGLVRALDVGDAQLAVIVVVAVATVRRYVPAVLAPRHPRHRASHTHTRKHNAQ